MDVERCIELHNEILRHGWIGHGNDPAQFESSCLTWTEYYGDDAEKFRPDLSTELYAFLSGARHIDMNKLYFFYWVSELSWPAALFQREYIVGALHMDIEDPGPNRYLLLYWMRHDVSHRLGLIFDQKTSLAILCPSFEETGIILNGRMPWYPLDRVLQAWLDMIRNDSVQAVPEDQMGDDDGSPPWVIHSCSKIMIQRTVDAFDRLVHSIEVRLPDASDCRGDGEIIRGLLDEDVLQLAVESRIIDGRGFISEFLRRARRPRFSRIAPGLEVPTSSNFTAPLFANSCSIPPLLLFRSSSVVEETIMQTGTCQASGPYDRRRSGWGPRYNAGLYLFPNRFEDEFQFILPFPIGANGYARMSDGSRFCEDKEEPNLKEALRKIDTWADLYRPGYQPFEDMREHRLVTLLENWRERVESGDWSIGADGVEGTMDVFREADTEHGWQKYVLPVG